MEFGGISLDYMHRSVGYGWVSTIGTIVFIVIGLLVVAAIASAIWKSIQNGLAPVRQHMAQVINRRFEIRGQHTSTNYYLAFELDTGERLEFPVAGNVYGTILDGEQGRLTFQGTWFLGFDRGAQFAPTP